MNQANDAVDPIQSLLDTQQIGILDGGLATELEHRGYDLDDPLWSARCLIEEPAAVRAVHEHYLVAGADVITAASYQATIEGFTRRGLDRSAAKALLANAVAIAEGARDEFWATPANRIGRKRPIVAASVGPYGAFLANGAEYTGDYDRGRDGLVEFHRERWQVLANTGADVLACETLPSLDEALALTELLEDTPTARAWLSFCPRDGKRIADGTPFADCVEAAGSHPQVVAIGVNCAAAELMAPLVEIAKARTTKPIIVYPNSGERYEAKQKNWAGAGPLAPLAQHALRFRELGAQLIGGCCRTRPTDVRELRKALL